VRRAFTEFHNFTKTENASPFLGMYLSYTTVSVFSK
jgi:hypothetical protein